MGYNNYSNDADTNQNQNQSAEQEQSNSYGNQNYDGQQSAGQGQSGSYENQNYDSRQSAGQGQHGSDGSQQNRGYGSYQSRQDSYKYRNYYDERYRSGQGGYDRNGYGSQNGYGGQNGYDPNSGSHKPKKRNSAGKVVAVTALVIAFVAFCGGISWMAVQSLGDVKSTVSEQAEPIGPEDKDSFFGGLEEKETENSKSEEQNGAVEKQAGEIASADAIPASGGVTAVVTDVTDVVDKVMPSCVSITNNFTQQQQDFWGQTYSRQEQAAGSGIIIGQNDTELLIATNNHVVDGADELSVQFIDGENVQAQVKGTDSSVDLAVIAVKLQDIKEETKKAIKVAQMGDSDSLRIGEPAIAIGNSLGYGQSVTTGVISALNRTLEVSETGASNALIQTDAAINPGNSGGALLNIRGEVIGINSSKIGGNVVEGMGYAIPISTAKPIIEELMTHETKAKVTDEVRGYLGISCINVTSDLSENFNMPEGIFVAQVYEGTGAERAGLVRGDIITAFDGNKVRNQDELTSLMQYYKAGETVEITIMQGSPTGYQAKNVQIVLSSLEELNAGSQQSQEQNVRP